MMTSKGVVFVNANGEGGNGVARLSSAHCYIDVNGVKVVGTRFNLPSLAAKILTFASCS